MYRSVTRIYVGPPFLEAKSKFRGTGIGARIRSCRFFFVKCFSGSISYFFSFFSSSIY